MTHPSTTDLALLAGGDINFARALLLKRHVQGCPECTAEVEQYAAVRAEAIQAMPPGLNAESAAWERLATEMRANIHLGLEAGACVRETMVPRSHWNPRAAIAFASLIALIGSGIVLTRMQRRNEIHTPAAAVLRSTENGVEVRSGLNSLELLNRKSAIANQTVGAQGQIGVRYVDDTGAVTINNVYLQ